MKKRINSLPVTERTGLIFMYTQQLQYMGKDGRVTFEEFEKVIAEYSEEYAYIIHDKDKDAETEEPVFPHFHALFRIKHSRKLKDVMKWFGETRPSQFELPIDEIDDKKKNNKWNNMLSYLCHRTNKSRSKFQYDFKEVVANFDYALTMEKIQKEIEENEARLLEEEKTRPYYMIRQYDDNGHSKGYKVSVNAIKTRIQELVFDGKLKCYNWTDYLDFTEYEYGYAHLIKCLTYYDEKNKVTQRLKLKSYYITGDSSTGKTNFAKQCAYSKFKFNEVCIINYQDPNCWDTYNGEPCLIIDDFRPKKGYFAELLNLLDPSRNAELHARFKNRYFGELECVYFTSTMDLKDLIFNSTNEDYNEKIDGRFYQLYRRIGGYYYLHNNDKDGVFNRTFDFYYFNENRDSRFPYTLLSSNLPIKYDAEIERESFKNLGIEELKAVTGYSMEELSNNNILLNTDTEKLKTFFGVNENKEEYSNEDLEFY